jgi:hypothetical protein
MQLGPRSIVALRRRGRVGGLRLGRRGVVAVEFAIIGSLLVPLMLGLYDISQALLIRRRVALAAIEIAEAASVLAVQANTASNQLTGAQVWTSDTAAFLQLPRMQPGGAGANYAITLSSVQFTPSSGGGSAYDAHVVWSSYEANGLPQLRACDTPPAYKKNGKVKDPGILGVTPAASNAVESLSTLPPSVYLPPSAASQPYPIIVADLQYTYTPMFLRFLSGPITFFRSRFVSPRIGTSAAYVLFAGPTSGSGVQVTACS